VKVFLAGATGVIGKQLLPMMLAAGHEVTGMTRSSSRAEGLRAAGADAVVCDAMDPEGVRAALRAAAPEAVIDQLTSLPAAIDPRTIERDFELNDRLRTEGTRILVDAARAAGAKRILAQSIAFSYRPGPPGTLHDEADPLVTVDEADKSYRRSAGAVCSLEETILAAGGIVLRYGYFYGPGSAVAADGSMGEALRARKLPVVGGGGGVWSFVQVADAAEATLAALEKGTAGRPYNIVDDDPAPVRDWMPALAQAVDAKPPRRVPAWLARPLAGSYGVAIMTCSQGASNVRAKRELGWQPAHASWREGFRTALG
jgi:nucleoside-diphosphate-sugar epimerase